ncbi:MAG TPA: glycosyltransferase family 2 protein [Longimicrobiales bacterium]|nr:glycosyltransferase family 2 protein [Longimicrobiales bacterium]
MAAEQQIVPDLSLVMPCYNEEESVAITVRRLISVFQAAGHSIEIIAVDNGSRDRTGDILKQLAGEHDSVRPCTVEVNQGYGHGILSGIPLARGRWIGFIPADGQIDAEDVARLYAAAAESNGQVLAKARRRFRMDGLPRKIISVVYNLLIRMLWPRLDSLDINGTPKILQRDAVLAMRLESRNWFLDPEIMLKAHAMGLRVLEYNVFARMRGSGASHVRASTCWEFFRNLLIFRFGGPLREWKRSLSYTGGQQRPSPTAHGPASHELTESARVATVAEDTPR